MRIALDAMGGDHGPRPVVEGAVAAVRKYGVEVALVGKARHLSKFLAKLRVTDSRIHIVDAPDRVTMSDSPSASLRKRQSSLAIAVDLVHRGDCDALVSPGNTGAVMAHCLTKWRTLPGVKKPAIPALMPTLGAPTVIIDAGANVDCKPRQLLSFALLGHVYAREVLGRANPRIGLLSNGEEDSKGNELVLEAGPLLRASNLNYLGHAEGRDIFTGDFDVVVCDGFVGNVTLKTAEGTALFMRAFLKQEARRSPLTLLGAAAMTPVFSRLKRKVDANELGGMPLLGLNGVCIICHGSAQNRAFYNAVGVAKQAVAHKLNAKIIEEFRLNLPPPAPEPGGASPES